ncbi:MAG: energy-coupling factor ABC transporter ATP-binding protein [Burkholderiaceae bacterium]|uniref:energy-coupling factor ABC transporter ATP-binding protein n=1 Tax=Herminiimonas sp. Marseille-P9896 TaxID=2742211 RepID=UPI00158A4898|nr:MULTISPECIES: energy-coupling factor ABC transporter ATP-binding protein [Oxalobacteraceae]MBX9799087.1 energy-coupling factor ABC transporter ATP-binding protein [Burkholderiaceae bacterium]
MDALLSIQRLQKSFHQRRLLDIEDLSIAQAQAYVLTGSNGSGKSTLMRILAGLESADTAEVKFQGETVQLSPYPRLMRDAIVYVHQHPVMFSTSVEENIAYGLTVRGVAKNIIAEKVEEAIAWAGIAHLRASIPNFLSGGEKQRVALARARVLSPKLLLLDEPTANLDGAAREQVIALIPTLVNEGGSVIMACHDRDLIALPGVQRLKIRDGKLEMRPVNLHPSAETPA